MQRVFLETSALIDLAFKDIASQSAARNRIPQGARCLSSRYVVFEIARGYLRYCILLYNQCTRVTRFSELMTYAGKNFRKPHFVGAILESFSIYFRQASATGVIEPLSNLSRDEQELLSFKSFLRGYIRTGWRRSIETIDEFINSIECNDRIEAPFIDKAELYDQRIDTNRCGVSSACGLTRYVHRDRTTFEGIRDFLAKLPNPDIETQKRARALHELTRHSQNTNFDRRDCYRSGDALIVHEVPESTTVISGNAKHIEPLCCHLGKPNDCYPKA